jgi:hypothetical protein
MFAEIFSSRFVSSIKNLEYDEREKHDSNVTLHKVQALFKDGLAILNIKIRKVSRKNGNERYNGVVVVPLSESDIGRFLVQHEFSFNNELSITRVVD